MENELKLNDKLKAYYRTPIRNGICVTGMPENVKAFDRTLRSTFDCFTHLLYTDLPTKIKSGRYSRKQHSV